MSDAEDDAAEDDAAAVPVLTAQFPQVRVIEARALHVERVLDSDLDCDPYVNVRIKRTGEARKTGTAKHTANPAWGARLVFKVL